MSEEFVERDLTGARFHQVDLSDAAFEQVRFTGARFRGVDLRDVRISGAELCNVEIHAEIEGLRINGVDVGPLVAAELDRLHPERAKLHPTDPAGYREAWAVIEDLWAGTVERARRLDPALLHEQVGAEWSFIETQRHLVFATDAWIRRGVLGEPSPWDPLDLPWDQMPDTPGIPRDREARPSLDEVLALRADRMGTVRHVIADLTEERLASSVAPVVGPGWPPEGESFAVHEALDVIINEEWWHRQFAERDLAALTTPASADQPADEV